MIPRTEIKVLRFWSWDTASLLSQRVVCGFQRLYFLFFIISDNEKMFKLPSLCLNTSSCWQQWGEPLISCQTEKCNFFQKSKQHVCQWEIIFYLFGTVSAGSDGAMSKQLIDSVMGNSKWAVTAFDTSLGASKQGEGEKIMVLCCSSI